MSDDYFDADSPAGEHLVSLDEFLISCQKSLARAVLHADQVSRSESEFVTGQKALYVIDGLELDISAAVLAPQGAPPGPENAWRRRDADQKDEPPRRDRVLLDFDAPAERRSRIKFRVESRPLDVIQGAHLELAKLPGSNDRPGHADYRAWLVDPTGAPAPDRDVMLHFFQPGAPSGAFSTIETTTDAMGRVEFSVDVEEAQTHATVAGSARELKGFTGRTCYFVWATTRRDAGWTAVAQPPGPKPPGLSWGKGGLPDELFTTPVEETPFKGM